MFDWPEQIQTSPTRTSATSTLFLPSIVKGRRPAGFQRGEFDHPLAILGGRADFLPLEFDGDFLAIVGRAPDGDGNVALEHRAVGEQDVRLDVGRGEVWQGKERPRARGSRR